MYKKLLTQFGTNLLAISLFEWIAWRDGPVPGIDPQWKKVLGQAILVTVSQALIEEAATRTRSTSTAPRLESTAP